MRAVVSLLLIGVAAAGCGSRLKLKPTRLSFDQFVNATVQLRRAAAETNNPAEYQLRKREIERKLHFSDDDLREFTRVHVSDVRVLSAAWDSVEARLDRTGNASKAAPSTGPDAAGHRPRPGQTIAPGVLPGGLPAVIQADSLRPPTDDTLPPPPPMRNPPRAALNEHKPFY